MKNIYKSSIAFTLILFMSCEEKITELSNDPNVSAIANDSEVLTSAIGYMGAIQDVDLNQGSFLWAQYYTWGIGVSIGNQERYVAQPDDRNGYWQRAYANCLADLNYLRSSESAAYRGVAGILTAYVFQGLVDHFGDVPYSEALQGENGVLTPAFDSAPTIYVSLVSSIDSAMDELALATNDIGDDDLVYGGDLNQWVKFANSLKLRLLMRTSEVDAKGSEITTLVSSGTFLESSADIAQISWSGTTGNSNPMWSVQMNGVGDFYFASNAMVNLLNSLNDPRLTTFYAAATTGAFNGQIRGINQGTIDDEPFTAPATDYSGSSAYANGATAPTVLMSPWEVWFLRTEAAARYGTADNEATAFANAVQANFDYMGIAGGAAYITSLSYSTTDPLNDRLNTIGIQKWISMNGTQEDEGWIETRRFDRPGDRIFTSGIFQNPPLSVLAAGTFPASWLYPATERSYNPKAPGQRAITDQLFWDN
jgi:hypothetical protein